LKKEILENSKKEKKMGDKFELE